MNFGIKMDVFFGKGYRLLLIAKIKRESDEIGAFCEVNNICEILYSKPLVKASIEYTSTCVCTICRESKPYSV